MKKYHQHLSFNTFAQRVLGLNPLSESELDSLKKDIRFSRECYVDETKIIVEPKLLSGANCVKSSSVDLQAYESGDRFMKASNLLLQKTFEKVKQVRTLLEALSAAVSENQANDLNELNLALRKDYGALSIYDAELNCIVKNCELAHKALPQQLELSLRTGKEALFANTVISELPALLNDEEFISQPANIRALQKVMCFKASLDNAVLSKLSKAFTPGLNAEQLSALICIILSASKSTEEFECAVSNFDFTDELPLHLIVETLNRSPVKINFITHTPLFDYLFTQLHFSEISHLALAFRALYFLTDEEFVERLDAPDIIASLLRVKDSTFNSIYRDIRRADKVVVSSDELLSILAQQESASDLSLVKWLYLFSLLKPVLTVEEKIAFLEKVMLDKGIQAVNTQEALTLIASIGLKELTSNVINDAYIADGVTPFMPVNNEYTLTDVFDSVLKCPSQTMQSRECPAKVSVVITTFNPDLTLLEASIQSVLNQTYNNIEIILVDDCSTSVTESEIRSLCDQFGAQDIIYLRNINNVGQYISRNKAIEVAKGEYIAIQDDDDVSHPQRIAMQIDYINREASLASFTKHIRFSDNGTLSIDEPRELLTFGDGPASLLFHRSLLELIGNFRDYRYRGDIDFRTRIETIVGTDAISYINCPMYIMRSAMTTISSLYEYKSGDLLEYFRNRVQALSEQKALS